MLNPVEHGSMYALYPKDLEIRIGNKKRKEERKIMKTYHPLSYQEEKYVPYNMFP